LDLYISTVNFWYHCSHIIAPLAALTSNKAKWKWGPEKQQAFQYIRNTIARQVLLKYPDFIKPFDIYTNASDSQLGAVISQDSSPVAFALANLILPNTTTPQRKRSYSL
jgi:RNase H-like domain found in reverse transcriptase